MLPAQFFIPFALVAGWTLLSWSGLPNGRAEGLAWETPTAWTIPLETPAEKLWRGARSGDLAVVTEALEDGADVNAPTPYGSTALCFAADRGHVEIVRVLLEKGANPNVRDTFYKITPLEWARSNGHEQVVELLLLHGLDNTDQLLLEAVAGKDVQIVEWILKSGKASPKALALARKQAEIAHAEKLKPLLGEISLDPIGDFTLAADELTRFKGFFSNEKGDRKATVNVLDNQVRLVWRGGSLTRLIPLRENVFAAGLETVTFEWNGEELASFRLTEKGNEIIFRAAAEEPKSSAPSKTGEASPTSDTPPAEPQPPYQPAAADLLVSSPNWPNFRGIESRGVADGQRPPVHWDVEQGKNVLWKQPIPGLGNSCPVIWGDKLFVTSAVNETANNDVRIGQYGDVDSVDDDSIHDFVVFCLDKKTGKLLWRQTAHTGKPAVKRHSKSSHANPTVATDGRHVVAFFGSEGLYCYDMDGNLKWKKDLGLLDSGWFLDAGYQWGFGSSPTLFEGQVIVQCDIQKGSFLASFNLNDGSEVWKVSRDEIPSWPTPNIHRFGDLPMLITHGTRAARGYDARDGALLWSLTGHSEIVVPTPFVAHDLIFVASGYSPVQPIIAIKPTMRGEIALPGVQREDGTTTPEAPEQLAWSVNRGGPYMPSPIVYGDYLYSCSNTGILTCYRATTGEELYKERIKVGGAASFTASPIAGDGHLYFTAEDGRVAVVQAGPTYKLVTVNPCEGKVLSTPAISEGVFYVRTLTDILALSDSGDLSNPPAP